MSTVADLQGEISLDPNPFIRGLGQAQGAWDNFHGNLSGGASQSAHSMGSISTAAIAMGNIVAAVAIKAAEAMKDIVLGTAQAGIAFNAMREQATVAFTNLLGSGQKAKAFLDELAAFANKTPFEFPDVVRAAQKFTAMGFSAKEVIPILTAVGNAVSAMGGTAEQIDRVSTALVQMKAKGKVSAEEMMQLAEAGIPAWQILADKIGKSIPEAMKLAEKGAIDANTAVGALVEGMQNKFGGMMEQQSKTWNGLKSTIADTFNAISGQIMGPFFEFARDGMQKFVDILPQIQATIGDLQRWFADTFSGVVQSVGSAITQIGQFFQTHKADIQLVIERVGQLAQDYIRFWGEVAGQIKSSLGVIMADLNRMGITNADVWNAVMFTVNAAVSAITGTIRSITLVVQGVVKAIELAWSFIYNILVKPIADAIAWARANIPIIGRLIDNVAARAAAAMSMYRGIQSAVEKSAKIGDLGESVDKSFTLSKDAADRIVNNFKKVGADAHSGFASALKGGGGKGGGSGKNEIAEAMRENLAVINEWLRETNAGFTITQRDLETLTKKYVDNLLAQARAMEQTKTSSREFSLQMRAGVIENHAMGQSLKELADAARNGADIIVESMSKVSLSFIKPKEDIGGLKEAMRGLEKAQEQLSKIAIKESEERAKAAEREFRNLSKTYDDLGRTLPKSWNLIIDAIVQSSGKLGTALLQHGIKIKGWASDVMGVIDTMPGKWGDATRKIVGTIDQWITFADKILGLLSKISDSIPSNIGGVVDAIIGIFKSDKATSGVSAAVGGLVTSATQSATGAATAAGQAAGGAVTGGISSGLSSGVGSVVSSMTGIFSAITGAVATFAQTFQSDSKTVRFAGGFLLGGPIGGILSAIFGGPSQFEKEKRQLQLDKMKADIATVYEDIKSTMVDTMAKGLALLEGIADSNVIDMPKKAIKRFVNKLGDLLTAFVDLSKTFKGEALAQAKLVSDNLGGGIDLMLGGAQLIAAIREMGSVSDAKIKEFVDTTVSILEKWLAAISEIEIKSAKIANKVSTKLTSSVELISKFPELIRSIVDAAKITITDAQLSLPFETAKRIMAKFFTLAEEFQGYALNRTAKAADQFKRVFESAKSIFDAFTNLTDYKPVGETVFDFLAADINYILKKMIDISQTVDRELLDLAAEISASIQTVLGTVKAAYDGFAALGTYKSIAADSFDALALDIRLAVNKMGEIADAIGVEAAEKAGKFAESAGQVVGIIKNAVEAFNALDDLQNVEEGPFNALEIYIRRSIEIMARISGSMTDALMQQVETFSNKTKSVFDALRSAVGVFIELSNLSGGRDVAGANFPNINAAFDGLVSFTERAVRVISELANSAGSEMVDSALLFATKAKVIFESITAGAGSIKAIGELKDAPFAALSAFTTGFADAMTKMSELVAASISFEGLTGDFRDHIEDAVRNLKEGVSALATVLTGVTTASGGQNFTLEQSLVATGGNNSLGLTAAGSSASASNSQPNINLHFHGPVLHDQQFKTLVHQAIEEGNRRWLG